MRLVLIFNILFMYLFEPDPHASYLDVFSLNWQDFTCYIFPPFSLIGKVLQKIRNALCSTLLTDAALVACNNADDGETFND